MFDINIRYVDRIKQLMNMLQYVHKAVFMAIVQICHSS